MPFQHEPQGKVQSLIADAIRLHESGSTISLEVLVRNVRTLIGGGTLTPGEANVTVPRARPVEPRFTRTPREALRDIGEMSTDDRDARMHISAILDSVPEEEPLLNVVEDASRALYRIATAAFAALQRAPSGRNDILDVRSFVADLNLVHTGLGLPQQDAPRWGLSEERPRGPRIDPTRLGNPPVAGPSEWRGRTGAELARIIANRAATSGLLDALGDDTRGVVDLDEVLDAIERLWR